MRLPTVSQYRAQMERLGSQYNRLTQLQTQAATEKKLIRSSDDPLLADKIKSASTQLLKLRNFKHNISLAESRQSQKESVADTSINMTQRLRELMIRAKSDTHNNSDRQAIAKELEGIVGRFYDLANSKDSNGEYIFSGIDIHTPSFSKENGQYIYKGSNQTSNVPIGLNASVQYSESGRGVFENIAQGNSQFSVSADSSNNTGAAVLTGGSVVEQASYIADEYSITIVTNSSGNRAYQIIGANSGQVIPAPPAAIPDDAPDFVEGDSIVFNGMRISFTGTPDVGDEFSVKPSESTSIFNVLTDFIEALNTPVNNSKEEADLKQKLGEIHQTLGQAEDHFKSFIQKVGNEGLIIDSQKELSENLQFNEELYINNIANVSLEKVLTEISQQNIALQVTQKIYLQLQETQYPMLMGG